MSRHNIPPDQHSEIVSKYAGCNYQFLSELLDEREQIAISRASVRRILLAEGIASPKTHRTPKHRQRRERYPQEGMLLQIDGSRHQWLEDRGPWLTLILVLAGFLPKLDKRFAVEPAQLGTAYRPLPSDLRLKEVFCFKYVRVVGADNTVRFGQHRLQLLASRERASYAKARVEVHERLDGSLAVYHEGKCLTIKEAPKEAGALRARSGPRAKGQACIGATTTEPLDVGQASRRADDETLVGMLDYSSVKGGRVEGDGCTHLGANRNVEGSNGRKVEEAVSRSVEESKGRNVESSGKESSRTAGSPVRLSKPAPNHPWRRPLKQPRVTESPNA